MRETMEFMQEDDQEDQPQDELTADGEEKIEDRTMGRLKVDLNFKSELTELPAGTEKFTIASIWGSQRGVCILHSLWWK